MQVCSTDQPHRTELGPRTLVWIVLSGHSCLGSQANSHCPSFPAHHCTSGSLLPAAITRLATSRSRASKELRPWQAPSSQQANSLLNYCCLAVFLRLQSPESAESIASCGAPCPGPSMLRGGAGTSLHPFPQHKRSLRLPVPWTRVHLWPPGPRTEARGSASGGRWGRRGPGLWPQDHRDPPGSPPSPPPRKAPFSFSNSIDLSLLPFFLGESG